MDSNFRLNFRSNNVTVAMTLSEYGMKRRRTQQLTPMLTAQLPKKKCRLCTFLQTLDRMPLYVSLI